MLLIAVLVAGLAATDQAAAQGLLVNVAEDQEVRLPRATRRISHQHGRPFVPPPTPAQSYRIDSLDINATLRDQVAEVNVSQEFVNTGTRTMEVCFVFPLPYDGAIDQLTLLVDGKEYPAKLLPADAARRTYEAIVRKNKDPALLEWLGTGMFKTSVFPVPAGAERTVTLRYTQLCRNMQGVTDFLFPLATAKYTSEPIRSLRIRLALESNANIKSVYSPTHDTKVERPDSQHAVVTLKQKNTIPASDFRLLYDVGTQAMTTRLLSYRPDDSEDGYFMLLASPPIKALEQETLPKQVVFVVDRSGSMLGKKIEQVRESLKFVINNLGEQDVFNILAYDAEVESFRPELQRANAESRRQAIGFVNGLHAGGATNLHGALAAALEMMQDTRLPGYIVFLTDGLPTAGITDEAGILTSVRDRNVHAARILTLGVGYDVNSRLLDRVAREAHGATEYFRPNEDIEVAVGNVYARIDAPVLTDATLSMQVDSTDSAASKNANRIYPKPTWDLFAGQQFVALGRYRHSGAAKVTLQGAVADKEQEFDLTTELVEKSDGATNAFIARLWAMRRIGEIVDKLDSSGQNQELIDELTHLATKHGILTRYTSFLADDTGALPGLALARNRHADRLLSESLAQSTGRDAFDFRESQQQLRGAGGGFGGSLSSAAPADGVSSLAAGARMQLEGKEATPAAPQVITVAKKTFYFRQSQWVDGQLNEEDLKQVKKVKRFSDAYFALIKKHGREVARYLALDGPIVLRLGGDIIEIE